VSGLDGNAAAGVLEVVFGTDVTSADTVCVACAAHRPVAELVAFVEGPGTVLRCRSCTSLMIVVVTIGGRACVDLQGLAAFQPGND
jgi:hypothetical protein